MAEGAQLGRIKGRRKEMTLLLGRALGVVGQKLSRPGDGEALPVEQPLDLQHDLDILTAVEAVPGFALSGFKRRELGLPKSQHIGLCMRQLAHLTDAEIKLVRDEDLGKLDVGGTARVCWAGSRHSKPQAKVEVQLQAILENCAGSVKRSESRSREAKELRVFDLSPLTITRPCIAAAPQFGIHQIITISWFFVVTCRGKEWKVNRQEVLTLRLSTLDFSTCASTNPQTGKGPLWRN